MQIPYTPAKYYLDAFNCPYCHAYSHFYWSGIVADEYRHVSLGFRFAVCSKCKGQTIWEVSSKKMVHPLQVVAPIPNPDLPQECLEDYLEARSIFLDSPRGAAALLRLCIQKLCINLGGAGKKIDDDIGLLVSKGLPVKIQQALDVVRVIGNNAVHPGSMSIEEKPDLVLPLFSLVNMIVDSQITQPKQVESMFADLPQGVQAAVAKRDGK